MALLHLEGLFLFYIIMISKMIVFSSKIGYFITFSLCALCFNLVTSIIRIEENSPISVIGKKYKNVDLFMSGITPVLQEKIVKRAGLLVSVRQTLYKLVYCGVVVRRGEGQ